MDELKFNKDWEETRISWFGVKDFNFSQEVPSVPTEG